MAKNTNDRLFADFLANSSGTLDEKLGFESVGRTSSKLQKTDIMPKIEISDEGKSFLSNHIIIDKTKKYGEGSYGNVYKATNKYTGTEYAVKIINKQNLKENTIDNLAKETSITTGLNHPNIIKTHFFFDKINSTEIYMDLVTGGDLYDYLNSFEYLNECRAYLLFRQMVDAVKYLHENYIVHGDIKLENILINNKKDLHLYLVDFGFSYIRMPGDPLSIQFKGTPYYASSELFMHKPNEGFPADVWALGVILYTMLTGEYPFENLSDDLEQLKEDIINIKYQNSLLPSLESRDLLKKIFTPEQTRINIFEIESHPWMVKWFKYIEEHIDCSE